MDNNLLAMRLAMGAIIVCTVGLIVQLAVQNYGLALFQVLLIIINIPGYIKNKEVVDQRRSK